MLNKILGIVVLLAVIAAGVYFYMQSQKNQPETQNGTQQAETDNTNPKPETENTQPTQQTIESAVAVFDTTEGSFEVTLDGKVAPKTVANFVKLSNEGYYAGTKFHRIIDTFMIQGGDPNSKNDDIDDDGQGGPGYTVPAEIGLTHKVGAIAAARLGDEVNPSKSSSGSQFYIVLEENTSTQSLNGEYTVFGYVTKGMDIVSKIGKTPTEPNIFTGEQSVPLKDVVVNKITIKDVKEMQ